MNIQQTFPYLLEVLAMSSIGAAFYVLAIRKEHRLRWNRLFLLLLPIVSVLVPLFEWPSATAPWSSGTLSEYVLEPVLVVSDRAADPGIAWGFWLLVGGGILSAMMLGRRLWMMLRFRQRCERSQLLGMPCYLTGGTLGTSSFWSWLFWDETDDLDEEQTWLILKHEQCHIAQRHSLDLLLMDLLLIPFWWNPAFHAIRSLMVANHEALADLAVVSVANEQQYRRLLLRNWLRPRMALTHEFHFSHIKHRIDMLSSFTTPKQRIWKYLMLIPVFTFSTWLVSCQSETVAEKVVTGYLNEEQVIEVDQPPKPLNLADIHQAIVFPEEVKESGEPGKVMIKVLVGKDGRYERHELIDATNEAMAQAVEAQIRDLTFEPAMKDGEAVKFWVTIPFRFVFE